jgi:hypothetical protein
MNLAVDAVGSLAVAGSLRDLFSGDVFSGMPILAGGTRWTLYREPRVLALQFLGDIHDDDSLAWQTAAKKNVDDIGWPRFAFVEPTQGHAVTSLPSRMRTAAFLRMAARNVERIAIVSVRNTSFMINTILRVAGAANVVLVDAAEAERELERMRSG